MASPKIHEPVEAAIVGFGMVHAGQLQTLAGEARGAVAMFRSPILRVCMRRFYEVAKGWDHVSSSVSAPNLPF